MDERFIYTCISEKVLKNARNRVRNRLSYLTNGRIDETIELVEEYGKLNSMCNDLEKKYEAENKPVEPPKEGEPTIALF